MDTEQNTNSIFDVFETDFIVEMFLSSSFFHFKIKNHTVSICYKLFLNY